MRSTLIAAAASALLLTTTTPALAKGCIRGAVVGGVAGHYVGRGHALAGAAVGCVAMHHHYAVQARQQREAARAARH
jgi:outer membrane lipoprotein SlyB